MPRMSRTGTVAVIVALAVIGIATAGSALAQPVEGQFEPMRSLPQQEQLPAAPLLVAAYAFVWAVLLVYVWTIWRRLVKVEREIQQLSSRVAETAARH
jgi:CcmD family protein